MTFLNPLDALIPKIPFSFFPDFWVWVTSKAWGSDSVGFWGSCQLSPFWGRGGVRPEGSIDPPPASRRVAQPSHIPSPHPRKTRYLSGRAVGRCLSGTELDSVLDLSRPFAQNYDSCCEEYSSARFSKQLYCFRSWHPRPPRLPGSGGQVLASEGATIVTPPARGAGCQLPCPAMHWIDGPSL